MMTHDYLLYDGDCPACASYVAFSRLRRISPDLQLLDARQHPDLVEELRSEGYEINDGMVMRLNGNILFGADVTRMMAALATDAGPIRRAVMWGVGAAPWSRRLYPVLTCGRTLLLRLYGRKAIP